LFIIRGWRGKWGRVTHPDYFWGKKGEKGLFHDGKSGTININAGKGEDPLFSLRPGPNGSSSLGAGGKKRQKAQVRGPGWEEGKEARGRSLLVIESIDDSCTWRGKR